MAVARTVYHVERKSAKPFIVPSSKPQWGLTLTERLRPYFSSRPEEVEAMVRSWEFNQRLTP